MIQNSLQSALRLIYPPRCSLCGALAESDFALCGSCWRDTPIISGTTCDKCGVPLPGESVGGIERCDACLSTERPWSRGYSALLYRDNARRMALSLKHGDRHDIVPLAATFMTRVLGPDLPKDLLFVPVPLHWTRMLKRRFNQAALLAQAVAQRTERECCPDALIRRKHTPSLEGLGADARFEALHFAITPHSKRGALLEGRSVMIVDDVMTSGATLSAATEACLAAKAREVRVLVLARAARAP
ncbi:MAG: double zinc ribbon domain-containing protein [Pseudomonadota bacterium]